MESGTPTDPSLRDRWTAFAASTRGRRLIRIVRALFLAAVLGYLAWELTRIGWREIWRELPTRPLFYVLFLALYLLLPATEVLIYRLSWRFEALKAFPAFLKKRIYNREVFGYSGEVYFFAWARRRVDASERVLLETIRDNNVISSVASTAIALVLLAVFLMVGEVRIGSLLGEHWAWYAGIGGLVLAALAPLAVRYRHLLFSMPVRLAAAILGIQVARLLLGQVLQIGQWAVVMPEVPLRVWFTFAAVSILLTRIPFIPNQNLIFMGVGVEMSGLLDVSSAAFASMLLVTNVMDKLLNVGLFGLTSLADPAPVPTRAPADEPEPETAEP